MLARAVRSSVAALQLRDPHRELCAARGIDFDSVDVAAGGDCFHGKVAKAGAGFENPHVKYDASALDDIAGESGRRIELPEILFGALIVTCEDDRLQYVGGIAFEDMGFR